VNRSSFRLIAIALVSLALTTSVFAQTSKGFFVGNIVDPNGAAVAGAVVKIINAGTGVTRETVSTADGSFRMDAVDPGTYRVEISQTGFKTISRENLIVTAAQTTDANFQLEVGTQVEMVNVTSGADVILQSQDGARVNTLSKREITDLVQSLRLVEQGWARELHRSACRSSFPRAVSSITIRYRTLFHTLRATTRFGSARI
jgi:Carboxypeptidase regulatory-like domain